MRTKSIKNKLLLVIIFILLFTIIIISTYSLSSVRKEILAHTEDKLMSDLAMSEVYLNNKYPGKWHIENGILYKGDVRMSGNNEEVDVIGHLTGDNVTIFQGRTRVATNVIDLEGQRAIGTYVSEAVEKVVLKEGKIYLGLADVVGRINQTAYKPLYDNSGEIVGMLFVGMPMESYDALLKNIAFRFVFFSFVAISLAIILLYLTISRGIKPLNALVDAANNIVEGKIDIPKLPVTSEDEFGVLSSDFNSVLDKLSNLLEELQDQANKDYLTGLYNRRAFYQLIPKIFASARERNQNLCLIILDVDQFKQINDTRGHDVGDKVLIHIAKTLQEIVPQSEYVFRFGGDEFVILAECKECTQLLLSRIKQELNKILLEEGDVSVSVSIGETIFNPNEQSDIDNLMKQADRSMYLDKKRFM